MMFTFRDIPDAQLPTNNLYEDKSPILSP